MPKRKQSTPEKKAPTRDRQKVVITPEELAEAERRLPEVIKEYRASYVGIKGRRDVEFKVLSASIEHDSIHLSVVITGTVSDPTNTATAKGEMIPIRVPAKIERREIDEPTENNEPVSIPRDQPDDDFIPFPDIG
jgi:hypothetical protein